MLRSSTLLVTLYWAFMACGTQKCPYKPAPIFEAGLPHIVQYKFEHQGPYSLESVLLDTDILLEVEQEVCESTQQEYRFMVKGNYTQYPDSAWVREAVRQMTFLSTFSPKQAPLRAWASMIEQHRPNMRLGEDMAVQDDIAVRIDRIVSPDRTTLRVILTQGKK